MCKPWFGGVAQLGEHLLCKQGVVGSSPITSTTSVVWSDGWLGCIAEKRQQSVLLVSVRNCDTGGVSKWRHCPWVCLRIGLCQGESGSGASLGASIACLTGCFGIQRWSECSEA